MATIVASPALPGPAKSVRISTDDQRKIGCIILKTVQWAVDCKKQLPTATDFRERIIAHANSVVQGLEELAEKVCSLGGKPSTIEAFHGSADQIALLPSKLLQQSPPKLVVTSPPYPGMHVLYHRWQVLGRRETAAPFWIANCEDGEGSAFYTFGDRRNQNHQELYFDKLLTAFTAIRKVIRNDAYVVQLVGFAKPKEQVRMYRETMLQAGFEEYECEGQAPSRFWRSVPNRKWYTCLRKETKATSEVLLVHRPRKFS